MTGGSGFIGSAVVRHLIQTTEHSVCNIDKLTYAGNPASVASVESSERYFFEKVDICNAVEIRRIFDEFQPDILMHLAAESHVDRSIEGPSDFISTNIVGTYVLLEQTRSYLASLGALEHSKFRFHHISTDEVFGDLGTSSGLFSEDTSYAPSSPYSASKASSDHLVRAWHRTFGLPAIITNCSNNYGPHQFSEKLIPKVISNALQGKDIPVYGDGTQIRDWLYVEDHAEALLQVALSGEIGQTYNIGGHNEISNIEVIKKICSILTEMSQCKPSNVKNYEDLITFVKDRAGHDVRYAIDASKIKRELNWEPKETFETGLRKTVCWYLDNPARLSNNESEDINREAPGIGKL